MINKTLTKPQATIWAQMRLSIDCRLQTEELRLKIGIVKLNIKIL